MREEVEGWVRMQVRGAWVRMQVRGVWVQPNLLNVYQEHERVCG